MRRTIALALTAMGALGLLSSALAPVADAAPSRPVHHPHSAAALSVVSSTVVGPVRQNPQVAGRDNGQSVLYGGSSIWFFDDTIEQNPFGFLSSSAATTRDLDASDGIDLLSAGPFDATDTSRPADFVPSTAPETAFTTAHASADCTGSADPYCGVSFALWPGAAAVDTARHRILVSYGKLCRGGAAGTPCASGFVGTPLNAGFVSVDMDAHTVTRLTAENRTSAPAPSPEGDDPTAFFPVEQDWGGAGMVVVGDTLYSYGACTSAGCGIASAPLDRVQDLSAWRYFAGIQSGEPQWSTSVGDAVPVIADGAGGGTVARDPATGLWVHSYLEPNSTQADYQTASDPWGPWTAPAPLFTAAPSTGATYASFAHPEYDADGGLTKYYTYYDSATGAQMLVRVTFARGR